jgi:hypothetical protein
MTVVCSVFRASIVRRFNIIQTSLATSAYLFALQVAGTVCSQSDKPLFFL